MPIYSISSSFRLLSILRSQVIPSFGLRLLGVLLVAGGSPALGAPPDSAGGMAMDMSGGEPNMSWSVPAGVTFGRMMPRGSAMVTYMPSFMGMDGNLVGTQNVSPQTIVTTTPAYGAMPMMGSGATQKVRIVPVSMNADMHMFGAMYAVSDVFNVVAMDSWLEKSMTMTTFAGMSGTRVLGDSTGSTSGFGDLSLSGLIRLYQDQVNHLHVNLGMSLPTGSNTETVTMLSVMNSNMTMRAPYGMQLGTGTYDGLIGLTYTGAIDRWSWGAAWRSRIPLDHNSQGYRFGALFQETGWGGLTVWPGVIATMRVAFSQQGPISGSDPSMTGLAETVNPAFYGGDRIDMLGGLEIRGATFGIPRAGFAVEAGAPVYQRLNGPQLSRDWQVDLLLSYAF